MDSISVPLEIGWKDLGPNIIRWSKGYYALLKQTVTNSVIKAECLEITLNSLLPDEFDSISIAEFLEVKKVSSHLFEKCARDLRAA